MTIAAPLHSQSRRSVHTDRIGTLCALRCRHAATPHTCELRMETGGGRFVLFSLDVAEERAAEERAEDDVESDDGSAGRKYRWEVG
jgi:hypothetical protein